MEGFPTQHNLVYDREKLRAAYIRATGRKGVLSMSHPTTCPTNKHKWYLDRTLKNPDGSKTQVWRCRVCGDERYD